MLHWWCSEFSKLTSSLCRAGSLEHESRSLIGPIPRSYVSTSGFRGNRGVFHSPFAPFSCSFPSRVSTLDELHVTLPRRHHQAIHGRPLFCSAAFKCMLLPRHLTFILSCFRALTHRHFTVFFLRSFRLRFHFARLPVEFEFEFL